MSIISAITGTPIYVVMSQRNLLSGNEGEPVAAYSDYPSALTYAISIFNPNYNTQYTAKDLVYLITLQPAITAAVTPTPAAT